MTSGARLDHQRCAMSRMSALGSGTRVPPGRPLTGHTQHLDTVESCALCDQRRLTTLEYTLIFVLIVIGAIALWSRLGANMDAQLARGETAFSTALQAARQPSPSAMTGRGRCPSRCGTGRQQAKVPFESPVRLHAGTGELTNIVNVYRNRFRARCAREFQRHDRSSTANLKRDGEKRSLGYVIVHRCAACGRLIDSERSHRLGTRR